MRKFVFKGVVALTIAMVAACAPKPPPPPPPPPPAPVVYIPPRPLPPLGAAPGLVVPPLGIDGVRVTINTGITPAQTVWNLRSAYNVAALNCLAPEHADILVGYKQFLTTHKKALATANKTVDSEYKKRFGTAWIRPREAYMTQVYNYYAYPATVTKFCDAALIMARESMTLKSADLPSFAQRNLAFLDTVFQQFFLAYEQYLADAAAWDAKYAPTAVAAPVVLPVADVVAAPAPAGPPATTPR
ncbi:hypothetical protein ACQKOE_08570 [Novosphingobium sp. NPDC080210]|uniref:hypothetical protein n=1 Tax=Novosphingobium sp. NPDC080210 TaxID=3390596 RepID=UPI003D00EC69